MITWQITQQQADQMLNVLAQRPYVEVAGLINDLARQTQASMQQANPLGMAIPGAQTNGAAAPQ